MLNFRKWLTHRLDLKLPEDTKRSILLSSLSAKVHLCDGLRPATLNKLNEVLALSHSANALRIPVHLKSVIWQGKEMHDLDQFFEVDKPTSTLDQVMDYVQRWAPSWLLYDRQQLKEDLLKLYAHRKELHRLSA